MSANWQTHSRPPCRGRHEGKPKGNEKHALNGSNKAVMNNEPNMKEVNRDGGAGWAKQKGDDPTKFPFLHQPRLPNQDQKWYHRWPALQVEQQAQLT